MATKKKFSTAKPKANNRAKEKRKLPSKKARRDKVDIKAAKESKACFNCGELGH